MRPVLFLSDHLAVWVGISRNRPIEIHVETLNNSGNNDCSSGSGFDKSLVNSSLFENSSADKSSTNNSTVNNSVQNYEPCQWLQGKACDISLILDGTRVEVDKYPLQLQGSRLRNASNVKALRAGLIKQFPESIVSTPSANTKLGSLLVQHTHLTKNQQQWLASVEAAGLTVSRVMTSAELVADMLSFVKNDVLVVIHSLGCCKHIVCRSGYAIFVRSFEQVFDNQQQQLSETVTHLKSIELIGQSIHVITIGISASTTQTFAAIEGVLSVQRFESMQEYASLAIAAENRPGIDNFEQLDIVVQTAKQALKTYSKNHGYSQRGAKTLLHKFREAKRRKRQHFQLASLIILCVVSATYTGVLVRRQQAQKYASATQLAALEQSISVLREELGRYSPNGLVLSDALLSASAIRNVLGVGPGVLLTMLGETLTAHEDLILDELTWVSFSSEKSELLNNQQQNIEKAFLRESLPTLSTAPDVLLVSLSGRSTSSNSLRDRQDALNALVVELQQQDSISDLDILESPLQAVAGSSAASPVAKESYFKIHFRVTKNRPQES